MALTAHPFIINNITFAPATDRLTIFPVGNSADNLREAVEVTEKLLRILIHTPIVAFGQNFEFEEENPNDNLLSVFSLDDQLAENVDFKFETISTEVVTSLELDKRILNFSRTFLGGHVRFKFNFHYEAKTATEAADKLADSFNNNSQIIDKMLDAYGIVLKEPEEENVDATSNN